MGLIVVLLFVLGLGAYLFVFKSQPEIQLQAAASPTPVASLVPMATEAPLKDQIIQALSQKNNWDPANLELNVSTTEGDFAKGDVRFKGEMGGGLWFAAKVNGVWKIVYDGNGMITCDQLDNYQNFPKDLIPDCYDKQTQKMVTR